jgi:hypothetical protein
VADSNLHQETEPQKRRSTRIVQAVPITVTGVDALGRPFQERTSTLIINCQGCRYQSKHYVLKNMWVTFDVPHNESDHEPRSVRARVTWIQRPRTVRELFQIGVELEVPGNVWGIAFPPGDWFPFPETMPASEIPASSESLNDETSGAEWNDEAAYAPPAQEPAEGNVRVLPLPSSGDPSVQLARQVARLVVEAKQQVQSAVRENATRAVAAETRPLLAALQTQLKDAAEKSAEAAVAAHVERARHEMQQRLQVEREESITSMRAEWSRELDRRIAEARQQIESQLSELERARRADFEQQIQNQLVVAIQKLQSLSGSLGANAGEVRAAIEQIRQNSAQAAAEESARWQELMDHRATDAQARLAQLEEAAKRVGEQISSATSVAETNWRGQLEADLVAAGSRWNEKVEASFAEGARRAAERFARESESATRQIEQQAQQRINVIGGAFSQVTAEAESALSTLRASISREAARGESTISQLQQSFEQFEARRGEFSSLLQAASDEWAKRGEVLLETQTQEMNRRAETAVGGMAERLQPVLESAGQQTIERLANELEQRLAPQITAATETLSKLAFDREQAEKALAEHQHRIWQISEHGVQDSVARTKELLAQVEKEFGESARTASARWFSELEAKATETTHGTFEALFKSAEWYEKKVQTQMQTTLEKGLDQATSNLREKAAELSGLFASELDHYSRSYVDHSQDQIQENARDAAEKASQQMAEAIEAAATNFTDRTSQLGREQFDQFQSRTNSAFEQSAARMEAHTIQVRSKLESDTRAFAAEFQRVLSQHTQQSLDLSAKELASQVSHAKESLRVEADSLDQNLRTSTQSLHTKSMEEYKQRLENASNSWLLTTVTKLDQQSQGLIERLAATTENRLKTVCSSVFTELGETLRLRLAGLSDPRLAPENPAPSPLNTKPPETHSEEQK